MSSGFGNCTGPKAKAGQRCFFAVVAVKSGSFFAIQSTNLRTLGFARRASTSSAWRCNSELVKLAIRSVGKWDAWARHPAHPAHRHGMMPGNGLSGRPITKPARRDRRRSLLLLTLQILIRIMFRMFAGHVPVSELPEVA